MSKIWVETPSGIHMAQWLDVATEDGLIDLSTPMSTDPPLGEWKIKVRHHDRIFTQTFQVGEYGRFNDVVFSTMPVTGSKCGGL